MSNLSQFFGSRCPTGAFSLTVASNTISFQSIASDLGSWLSGGHVICKSSGTAWIVAPRCAEVSRTWYCREDAVTQANNCTGCVGNWFVPTCGQLQNPGYTCRTYWDSFSSTNYWSSTESTAAYACYVCFTIGGAGFSTKSTTRCVRAFRCVTY